jgi:hypothetical protein
MKSSMRFCSVVLLGIAFVLASCSKQEAVPIAAEASAKTTSSETSTDPLPSWNDGQAKQSIVDFVNATTDRDSAFFVPEAERIAVFDNDGTLWAERRKGDGGN